MPTFCTIIVYLIVLGVILLGINNRKREEAQANTTEQTLSFSLFEA